MNHKSQHRQHHHHHHTTLLFQRTPSPFNLHLHHLTAKNLHLCLDDAFRQPNLSPTRPAPLPFSKMKGHPIDQVVYEHMFPKPKPTDPQNFQGLLQRQLVPEVRLETQGFYGHLSSQEAKYPGLDYSYQPHRNRLSRFPWHRRLFRAFDNLGLTDSEIQGLTKWEVSEMIHEETGWERGREMFA